MHRAMDVLLFNLAYPRWEFVFQPTAAAYLNLIEPWWKTRKLAGFQRAALRELGADRGSSARSATTYWNGHRHPYVWEDAGGINLTASPALLDTPWQHELAHLCDNMATR